MDDRRFDRLVRSLADPRTRRFALQYLGGGLLAGSALAIITDADAKKRKGKRNRKNGKKRCKESETRCKKKCVDLQTHVLHCGECNNKCDLGQNCFFGECVDTCSPICTAPEVCCGDECTDLTSTAQHCGNCFTACAENEVCRFSNCGCEGPRCPADGAGGTRCCPQPNSTCCEGGKCCPNNGVCVPGGLCCDAGSYQCPGTDVCCPVGLICSGFKCLFPERDGPSGARRSEQAKKATRAL